MSAPRLARTTYGKGSAARQGAIRKGKVAASKEKLDALNERIEAAAIRADLFDMRHSDLFGERGDAARARLRTLESGGNDYV
jgi:hypothetical protein